MFPALRFFAGSILLASHTQPLTGAVTKTVAPGRKLRLRVHLLDERFAGPECQVPGRKPAFVLAALHGDHGPLRLQESSVPFASARYLL